MKRTNFRINLDILHRFAPSRFKSDGAIFTTLHFDELIDIDDELLNEICPEKIIIHRISMTDSILKFTIGK